MTTYAPLSNDFLVNTITTGSQTAPAIGKLAGGGFVVTWSEGGSTDIHAQIYSATGAKVGGEFTVNTTTTSFQTLSAVVGLANGNFVVTWTDSSLVGGDASGQAVKAQIFTATGVAVGSEFLVNTTTTNNQSTPAVTALGNGFVIAYTNGLSDSVEVLAQIFDADGAKIGAEFMANTVTTGAQQNAAITALANGNFVVTWESGNARLPALDIKGQLFSALGQPIGGEFLVNASTAGNQISTDVAALAGGGFVVTWADAATTAGDTSSGHIAALVYNASGQPVGAELLVNTQPFNSQITPAVTALPDGGFLITWTDASGLVGDPFSTAIAAQRFDASGVKIGDEFRVNTVLTGSQAESDITVLNNGSYVVTWSDNSNQNGDTSLLGINARVFAVANAAPVITSDGGGATAAITHHDGSLAVTIVTATDADAGTTLAYAISGGADAALFHIDAATGALAFINAPTHSGDADHNGIYQVTVSASDGVATDTQTIEVTVPNNAPTFNDAAPLDLSVREDTNINWSVATVDGSDADGDGLSYSLGGADASNFRIDAATGELFFDYWPDYERPADADQNNTYDLIVNLSDGTDTVTKAVTVHVTNVNEAPDFVQVPMFPVVDENTTAVGQVRAIDPESGDNVTYSIYDGYDGALFEVDSSTGELSFRVAPDFENPADSNHDNIYAVLVVASDGTNTSYAMVEMEVQDVVENLPPEIISYNAPGVMENSTSVLTVGAIDPDSNTLTYAIDGGADSSFFTIDAATGNLSFITAPDYEAPADKGQDNTYEVVVSVSDGTNITRQTLNVQVGNENEAPVIVDASEVRNVSYSEIQSFSPFMDGGDTSVTRITASDPEGQGLTYTLTGADSNRFWISPYDGALYFNSTPDYERPADADGNNIYDVTVGVSDGVNTAFQSVSVTVTDGNDTPTFITDFSNAPHVAENTTYITTVLGTDQDAGTHLTYSIGDGPDAALFQIDAQTGVFSFISAPDYENPADEGHDNIYMTFVNISDGVNTVNQFVWVYVDNVDPEVNHPPVFVNTAPIDVSVQENSNSWGPIVTVTATDPDVADHITYSLAQTDDSNWFMIDPRTGGIMMMGSPDFERPADANHDNIYQLTVNATDGTNTVSTTVNIQITDGYDYPYWVNYLYDPVHAAENQTATVTLAAGSQNVGATFTYDILDGADRALFNIDHTTGAITFKAAPDFENPGDANHNNVYELFVTANDGTNGIFMGVNIVVDNVVVENHAPTFNTAGPLDLTVAEDVNINWSIATVAGSDADGNTLTYSLGGTDAARFNINAATGELFFDYWPDYERPADADHNNTYDIVINMSDGTDTVSKAVTVHVSNVNETPEWNDYYVDPLLVDENTTAVGQVQATDPESGSNLTYSIGSGYDGALFDINSRTGQISFRTAPDFENPADSDHNNSYQVAVMASDGSNSAYTVLTVQVQDVVENHVPVMTSNGGGATAALSVAENTVAVTTVAATDADAGTTITYSIAGGADAALFAINAATGALTFVTAPNFEAPTDAGANNTYDVIVRASDGIASVDQALAVAVTNANERPGFSGPLSTFQVAENTTAVGAVQATDPDAGTSLVYSLAGPDAAYFQIDAATGAISFINAPNYESSAHASLYSVLVNASDGVLMGTQVVNVQVTDVNEAPAASGALPPVLQFRVAENLPIAMPLGGLMSDPEHVALTYSVVGGADAALFTIDPATGVLNFVTPADYEHPTDADHNDVYEVVLGYSDGVNLSTQAFALTVGNIDEAPVITSLDHYTVVENSGVLAVPVAASDPEGSALYYYLGGDDAAWFTVDKGTGAISFKYNPDFENAQDVNHDNVYALNLTVSDGVNKTTQAITVTVTDVNEAPYLASGDGAKPLNINLPENWVDPVELGKMAKDPEGANLVYTIAGGADAALFTVSAKGAVSFISKPDYERPLDQGGNNVYEVVVGYGDGVNVTTQAYTFTITDVLETPVITSDGGGASVNLHRPENTTAVTTVTTDLPGATYSITGGVHASMFTVDANTGVLSFINAPDYEHPTDAKGLGAYQVEVKASIGTQYDTQIITVYIDNVAEAPVITSNGGGATAAITMGENLTAVTTVQAQGSAVTYAIAGGADAAMFTINAATGALAFKAPSDYDTAADADHNNVYDVVVSATSEGLTDTQSLSITLTDTDTGTGVGGSGNDALHGTVGRDLINGYAGNDTIWGEAGNDTLYGGSGNDSLLGGLGDDLFYVTDAGDQVVENAGEGNDTVNSSVDFTLGANIENLIYTGSANWTANGNDQDNWIYGGAGADTIHGQGGNDYIAGGAGDDTAYGDDGADSLVLGAGNDHGYGGAGSDTLNGGTGIDTLEGGAGDDVYYVDSVGDVVVEAAGQGTDTVFTTVDYTLSADVEKLIYTGGANWTATGNATNNYLAGAAGNDTLWGLGGNDGLSGGAGNDSLDGGDGFDTLTGGTGDDTLTGGEGNDSLDGGDGNDLILGGAGNDSLAGGLGTNALTGGAGDDLYIVSNSTDTVVEVAGEGNDTISALVDFTMGDNIESMIFNSTANWTANGNDQANWIYGNAGNDTISGHAGNDYLSGNAGNDSLDGGDGNDGLTGGIGDDTLVGGAGNDTLNGDAGNDSMIGGAGDDTYFVNSALDAVVEAAGEGRDTVLSTISTTLADNVEALIFNGVGNFTGTGNALANYITGGAGNDTIYGLAGDDALYGSDGADQLFGGEGQDTLNGAAGRDTMSGGAGDDSYWVENALDVVVEAAGEGRDTVFTTVNLTLADNVEKMIFTGTGAWTGTGNDLSNYLSGGDANDTIYGLGGDDGLLGGAGNDQMYGGDGADTLNGGTGNDTMAGGAGNDSYTVDSVGDVVTENSGEGSDTILTSVDLTLADNVEQMLFSGTGVWNGTGNGLDNYVAGGNSADVIYGLGGNDMLVGNGGNDQLYGGDGNDTLYGGAGADTMTGGAGDDAYTLDNAGDVVVENADEGSDTVMVTFDYALGDNLEKLMFTGTGNWTGTGNGLNNFIAGGAGDDTINGGGGADAMDGGLGADQFIFSSAADAAAGDVINDFNRTQGDLIDLSAIDANTLTAEDDEFSWVGNAGFSNTAGELRYELVDGNVVVSGDVDGDGVADFNITLKGVTGETPAFGGILLGANTVDWHDFVL